MAEIKIGDSFDVRLYLGSRKGYDDKQYQVSEVIAAIAAFQAESTQDDEPPIPVRVTPTTFVSKDYVEEGWEIAVVRYPIRDDSQETILDWAGRLGGFLMSRFRQERISAVVGTKIVVFAQGDSPTDQPADQHPDGSRD